jgi:hypothetical protein
MAQWYSKPYKVIIIGTSLISNNNTKRNSKINKGYHVPGSLFLSHNKNSLRQCSIFLQIHDSENFFNYEGVNTFLREFFKHFWKILACNTMHTLNGFTTFAYSTLASVHENTMTSFDTNSSFWVCDNSATGHICNDRNPFISNLVPSIYIVGAATGTLEPTLMGTVQLRITDNDGEKHTFTLIQVNYMPTSPVNLLSTRVLS